MSGVWEGGCPFNSKVPREVGSTRGDGCDMVACENRGNRPSRGKAGPGALIVDGRDGRACERGGRSPCSRVNTTTRCQRRRQDTQSVEPSQSLPRDQQVIWTTLTASVAVLTNTSSPVSANLGTRMRRTCWPSSPAAKDKKPRYHVMDQTL